MLQKPTTILRWYKAVDGDGRSARAKYKCCRVRSSSYDVHSVDYNQKPKTTGIQLAYTTTRVDKTVTVPSTTRTELRRTTRRGTTISTRKSKQPVVGWVVPGSVLMAHNFLLAKPRQRISTAKRAPTWASTGRVQPLRWRTMNG